MKLHVRILLLVAVITLSIGIITITLTTRIIEQGFDTIDTAWSEALAASLSEGIAPDTINGNATHVNQVLETVVSRNSELDYAYVVDFDNKILAHTFKDGFPAKIFNSIGSETARVQTRSFIIDGADIDDLSFPIIEGMSARLHLGLNEEFDELLIRATARELMLIVLLLGLVGISIAFPLSRQLTRPLEKLGSLMLDYGGDKLKGTVTIPGGSFEMRRLGAAFEQMIKGRVLAEEELNNYRDQLEHLVEERTRELESAQDELLRSEKLATLGQLTATVSHELRNPLGAMRPSLYIIQKRVVQEDERVRDAIDRLDRNIDRCDHIIDELLDFTRITNVDKAKTRIDEWFKSIHADLKSYQGLDIEYDLNLADVEVSIDPDRLRRAVINLVENASQAMLEKNQFDKVKDGSCLEIKTARNDDRIEIKISDNGIGMSDEVLKRVFEPLFSTKGFGVGLGMPAVKQIVEQHDGGLEIETKPGHGTTITIWLPLGDQETELFPETGLNRS